MTSGRNITDKQMPSLVWLFDVMSGVKKLKNFQPVIISAKEVSKLKYTFESFIKLFFDQNLVYESYPNDCGYKYSHLVSFFAPDLA